MDHNQENITIGTVGHVDHGKTTLIQALTGFDTDRLGEEKERRMTTEPVWGTLGLPSGKAVSVVDLPGHQRFIKNMLRGISGVDIAILVVAADDGVMPQTREHFDLIRLLNIEHSLIVISKVDLVDEETVEMATQEVRDLVGGTALENAPIIAFSARTGRGIEEIKRVIEEIADQVTEKNRTGILRIPIDRVFTVTGYGTIVTGIVISGKVRRGDALEIYPLGRMTTARNIQIHNRGAGEAEAGHRVGLNLANVKVEDLKRGMVLGAPQSLISTHLMNARFQYLPSNLHPLHNRIKVKLYSRTSEVITRIMFVEKEELFPGEDCFVQFRLEKKVTLSPYDRYIVRTLSPKTTIGGGIILETNPWKYRSGRPETVDHLHVFERKITHEMVEALIKKEKTSPVRLADLARKLSLTLTEIETACARLLEAGSVLLVNEGSVIHKEPYEQLKTVLLEAINNFHARNRSQKDASQEEIRSKLSPLLNQRLYEAVLQELRNEEAIEMQQGRIRMPGFRVKLGEKQKYVYDHLEAICKEYHFRPLPLNVFQRIKDRYGERDVEGVVRLMIGEGRLIKLNNRRLIHSKSIDEFKAVLKEHIQKNGRVVLGESMEVFGLGRPQVQPIFDYLDSIRFTMRIGDYRVLYKSVEGDNKLRDKTLGEEVGNRASSPAGGPEKGHCVIDAERVGHERALP